MEFIKPLNVNADDVSSEFSLKNAKVFYAVEDPNDEEHSRFIKNGNVFALEQTTAKTFVNGKLLTIAIALPTISKTRLYMIGEDGFHADDYKREAARDSTLCPVYLHISDFVPQSNLSRPNAEGVLFLEDSQFEKLDEASPT